MVATFSKGTMRFIGGKLSKNEGGVKVNTPAGALAIRGGMVQGSHGSHGVYSFLYGVQMSFTGRNGRTQTVYRAGLHARLSSGTPTIRPTTPQDTQFFMSALSPGGTTNTNGTTTPVTPNQNQFQLSTDYSQVINEATTTQIQDEIQKQLANFVRARPQQLRRPRLRRQSTTTPTTPVETTSTGYASGAYAKDGGPCSSVRDADQCATEVGHLSSLEDGAFEGRAFDLTRNSDAMAAAERALLSTRHERARCNSWRPGTSFPTSGLFFGFEGADPDLSPSSIKVFNDTAYFPPQSTRSRRQSTGNYRLGA